MYLDYFKPIDWYNMTGFVQDNVMIDAIFIFAREWKVDLKTADLRLGAIWRSINEGD